MGLVISCEPDLSKGEQLNPVDQVLVNQHGVVLCDAVKVEFDGDEPDGMATVTSVMMGRSGVARYPVSDANDYKKPVYYSVRQCVHFENKLYPVS